MHEALGESMRSSVAVLSEHGSGKGGVRSERRRGVAWPVQCERQQVQCMRVGGPRTP